MSEDRYARIYFDRIERDPKFDGIRNRRDLMGSWQFLLVEAEKAWPSPAFLLPTSWVPTAHVRLFAERGIIDMTTDGRFELHGLGGVRAERSKHASTAAQARWANAPRNAPSIAPAPARSMPRQDETSRDEERQDDGRADIEAFLLVRYRPPTPGQRDLMDAYVRTFDETGPQRAADLILRNPTDPIGALKTDLQAFRAERIAEAQKAERPAPVRRRTRSQGFTGINAEIQKVLAAQYANDDRAHRHRMGEHAVADPMCDACRAVA